MNSTRTEALEFAPAHDAPVPYLQRIRTYYQALGYGAPYEWAHYAAVPFQPLNKPLAQCRVALVTTAAPYQPDKGDQGSGAAYNAAAKFYSVYSGDTAEEQDLRISHIAIDRAHTTAEDLAAYFPLAALRNAKSKGRIGSMAPRFHGLPTNRSHRVTLETDCPEILSRCREDAVDAAILVPNCPICHQSVSLAARMLEVNGIATVVMACAKDIVEYVGVPRLLGFSSRKRRGPAERSCITGANAGAGVFDAGARSGPTDDRSIPSEVERRSGLEAGLLQHRSPYARGDQPAPRRFRHSERDRKDAARRRFD